MRPYMCTPQALQAWRWMVALPSTTASLSAFFVTLTLSLPTTATTENTAPLGFQYLVQPQGWLCAVCDLMDTSTGSFAHLQVSVPPAKSLAVGLMPLSTEGWIEIAAM